MPTKHHTGWPKGRRQTPEHSRKIAEALTGRKLDESHRDAIRRSWIEGRRKPYDSNAAARKGWETRRARERAATT
jgi:hypothetical protein